MASNSGLKTERVGTRYSQFARKYHYADVGTLSRSIPTPPLTRDSPHHPVFDWLTEDKKQLLLDYLNQDWLCAGVIYNYWPTEDKECVGCCKFCGRSEECDAFRCYLHSPLKDMDTCDYWITRTEVVCELLGILSTKDIRDKRNEEREQMFDHFHMEREE